MGQPCLDAVFSCLSLYNVGRPARYCGLDVTSTNNPGCQRPGTVISQRNLPTILLMGKRAFIGDDERPDLLTVDEAARRLRIGRTFLYELIKNGEIVSLKVGKLRRFPPEALQAYVERKKAEQGY